MNSVLVGKELKDIRWKLLIGFLAIAIATAVIIALYDQIMVALPTDPAEFPAIFGPDALDHYRDFTNAMWANLNDKNLLQFGAIIAIILGIGLLGPELESGTITLLLTNGLSRRTIFWTKVLVASLSFMLMLMAVSVLVSPLATLFGQTMRHQRLIPTTFITSLGLTFLLAVSLLISIIVKEKIWSGVISALLFGTWSIAGFWESTRSLSPFHHMRAADYFFGQSGFPWLVVIGFVAAIAVALLAAERRFLSEEL